MWLVMKHSNKIIMRERGLEKIEEGSEYGVPVKILTKRNKSDAITIDVKIEPQDEAYKSVGGNKSGFILGPYKIDDVTGFHQFDGLIEKMLREEALQQLDEMFCSGTPSLKDKISFYNTSKDWKSFQDKHNSRVRWWLGEFFFESLIGKYSTEFDYILLSLINKSPCYYIEMAIERLKNPLLAVACQQKNEVTQDLLRLNRLLNKDELLQPFIRMVKTKELAESRNLVRSLVSELANPKNDYSFFDILQNKDKLILFIEHSQDTAKENALKRLMKNKVIDHRMQAIHDKEYGENRQNRSNNKKTLADH